MKRKFLSPRDLCLSGIIAAVYAALTLALPALSFGPMQCRLSEALTLLPILFPQAVPGLFVGCLAANLLSPVGLADIVFGSLATFLAALSTRVLRKRRLLAALCPVLLNGVIVGVMLSLTQGLPLWLTMGQIALGEAAAVFLLGPVLLSALKRVELHP